LAWGGRLCSCLSYTRFLQSSESNIRLDEDNTTHDQGLAVVSCLLSGLEVFSPAYPDNPRSLRVLRGLHGLHVYAHDYWVEYLLSASRLGSSTESRFAARSTQLAVTLNSRPQIGPPITESRLLDGRLAKLQGHAEIFKAVQTILSDRAGKEDQITASLPAVQTGQESQQALSEVTDLASLLSNYQSTIQALLRQWKFPGISIQELEKFKQDFRTTAFTCRYWACPYASMGFEDESQRRKHEQQHAPRLACDVDACQYPPFVSVQALNSHKARLHKEPMPNIKIKAPLIRQKKTAGTMSSIHRDLESGPPSSRRRTPVPRNTEQLEESNQVNPTFLSTAPKPEGGDRSNLLLDDDASPAVIVSDISPPIPSPRIPPTIRSPHVQLQTMLEHSALHRKKQGSRYVSISSLSCSSLYVANPFSDRLLGRRWGPLHISHMTVAPCR